MGIFKKITNAIGLTKPSVKNTFRDERLDARDLRARESAPKTNSTPTATKKLSWKINALSGAFNAISALVIVGALGATFDSDKIDNNTSTSFDTQNSQEMTRPVPRPKGLGD